ncbi:MAG: hypothetical protein GY866_04050 [Proteobacteria bacterium]|nr:hypothetical protein [Pseudomonadota bacterium]
MRVWIASAMAAKEGGNCVSIWNGQRRQEGGTTVIMDENRVVRERRRYRIDGSGSLLPGKKPSLRWTNIVAAKEGGN